MDLRNQIEGREASWEAVNVFCLRVVQDGKCVSQPGELWRVEILERSRSIQFLKPRGKQL